MENVKILVVDDEPMVQSLINQKFKNKIKSNEFEFYFASNGSEALELLSGNEDISVILLDLNMPVMNGFTFMKNLEGLNRLNRVIVVTAYGDMINIRKAMNSRASDFITKPIDLEDLANAIDRNIKKFQELKEADASHKELIKLTKELEVAKTIQQSLMPTHFDDYGPGSAIEVFGEVIPTKDMGGDFFDVFTLETGKVGFFIGEAAGRGIPAAIFMTMCRTLLRTFAFKYKSPSICFEKINKLLLAKTVDVDIFLTAFYGIIDLKTGIVKYCDAGHRPLFILTKDKKLNEIGRYGGIPLAVTDDPTSLNAKFEDQEFKLNAGDVMTLYTSGVVQMINASNEMYTEDRLKRFILEVKDTSPIQLTLGLKEDLLKFSGGKQQMNDVSIFALRFNGLNSG